MNEIAETYEFNLVLTKDAVTLEHHSFEADDDGNFTEDEKPVIKAWLEKYGLPSDDGTVSEIVSEISVADCSWECNGYAIWYA